MTLARGVVLLSIGDVRREAGTFGAAKSGRSVTHDYVSCRISKNLEITKGAIPS